MEKPNLPSFVPSPAERAEYREYTKDLAWIQHCAPRQIIGQQIKEAVFIASGLLVAGWVLRKALDVAFGIPKVTIKTPNGEVTLQNSEN